ncbi:hypothetical protein NOL04_02285 [Streptococcus suis]|uniref:Phage protein n=1 Tax=Streptococcus suis TaxID=1307 RepID=A0AAP6A4D2_STRSU|nr:hypothetical protein [Streptococcus suis]AGF87333.1 hypothetical protein phi20c_0043 [Streptococcus phage phi20c]QBX21036.1 hypothetical protein Javan551_0011 [Streptococcus phage Javan551]QBX30488.1 hypothetical protein Javan548_0011 [Streptococcus phage Javan548]AWX96996.1 hypothetical protein BKM67_02725 [Streptococcus suis]MBM7320264.1 hypothetical protein [Streptococcus suis]
MVRNKMSNLADTLFAQLEYLDDRELSENELKIEIERSKAMVSVAGQIVSVGKLAIDAKKLEAETGNSAGIALLE